MANPNRNATIPDSPEGVVANRKVNLCPKKQQMDLKDLIITCDECGQFLLFCCGCSKTDPDRIPCHNGQVIFVDGACQNNGTTLAQSGMGLAMGATSEWQLSFPITNEEDDSGIRSNQRAELCAAKHALDLIDARSEEEQESASYSRTNTQRRVNHRNRNDDKDRFYIVATDSEYVVKGMTEWLPTWKTNKWRTSKGSRPANLDLFIDLDEALTSLEARNVKIGFWHVPRAYNDFADKLAKTAAKSGHTATATEPRTLA